MGDQVFISRSASWFARNYIFIYFWTATPPSVSFSFSPSKKRENLGLLKIFSTLNSQVVLDSKSLFKGGGQYHTNPIIPASHKLCNVIGVFNLYFANLHESSSLLDFVHFHSVKFLPFIQTRMSWTKSGIVFVAVSLQSCMPFSSKLVFTTLHINVASSVSKEVAMKSTISLIWSSVLPWWVVAMVDAWPIARIATSRLKSSVLFASQPPESEKFKSVLYRAWNGFLQENSQRFQQATLMHANPDSSIGTALGSNSVPVFMAPKPSNTSVLQNLSKGNVDSFTLEKKSPGIDRKRKASASKKLVLPTTSDSTDTEIPPNQYVIALRTTPSASKTKKVKMGKDCQSGEEA